MITIENKDINILSHEFEALCNEHQQSNPSDLSENTLTSVKTVLSSMLIKTLLTNLQKPDYFNHFNYNSLAEISEIIEKINTKLQEIKKDVDIEIFLKDGYNLNIAKLKHEFRKKKLYKELRTFKFNKLKKLYRYPPEKLKVYHSDEEILIDPFVFRKYLLGIIQMLLNEMDLLVCFVGSEGSGKSVKASQDMFLLHYLLVTLGVTDYEFDIKEMWFNTLPALRETEDRYFKVPYRIIGLDEGNELNRQNWKDDEVSTFFQRLRRERYNRRIKFICIPVLGELIPNIVTTRINFIFEMEQFNELETGTLSKGSYNFYIIPRGSTIYSVFYKKTLSRDYIKQTLHQNLKDREYLKGMPKEIIIKKCRCNGVWGFKKELYIKHLKDTNRTYSVRQALSFGYTELFNFYKARVTLKKLGIKKEDIKYASLSKMLHKINNLFYENPDLLQKYEIIYKKKLEDKEMD